MTGKLVFENNKWKISFQNEKDETKTLFCQPNVFLQGFNPSKEEETEIDFERDNTPQKNACKVRPKGQEWQGQERTQTINYNRQNPVGQQRYGDRNQRDFQNQPRIFSAQSLEGKFHNPYNFVPAIPRENIKNELGNDKPIGHDRFYEDFYSGKLTVKMTIETPLVILDTAKVKIDKNDHKSFSVRVDSEGKPLINPTAVKGVLRSTYEAITNSRMSVFTKHEDRLAFRREAKSPIPVRIEERNGNFFAKPLEYQKIDNRVMNGVAKLPRYAKNSRDIDKGESRNALRYISGELPKHGDAVFVKYRKIKAGAEIQEIKKRQENEISNGDWVAGWTCITGANISGKRFERVFLDMPNSQTIPVDKNLWEELVRNYQETHKKDLEKRKNDNRKPSDYLGDKPGKTAWSRHIYSESDLKLKNGTLCYAEIDNGIVKSIFPVMISRQLFESSPADLLDKSLKPASDIEKLSPADRVFGCVIQNPKDKKKAITYRGQIRIGSVTCQTEKENAIEYFDDLPLNILGQPKPQQGRFYVAETSRAGEAQIEKRSNEDAGYKVGRGLRGRKVYPHHANLPKDYWTNRNGLREYMRPDREQDSQNRSIEGWVKPQTVFEFDIHFTNLSKVEFGALVWLLSLNGENENKYFHRFGGGKPYGFGSVKLEIIGSDVRDGKDLKTFYMSLDDEKVGRLKEDEIKNLGIEFKTLADSAFPTVISSFIRACEGFSDNKATHYPRKSADLDADTKSFDWFVANSKIEKGTVKNGYVLQDLANDKGLPYLS